ncbi:MAG: Crp/Fnr family transcriptional regulator [Gordonibacter sp.]|uniref:Crp/Fnr family transcriptional regulator n=1 Tax=Gordonibacter sp. TaxID=1968902 RepID=UPI002FC83A90
MSMNPDKVAIVSKGAIVAHVGSADSDRIMASFIAVSGDVINVMRVAGATGVYPEDFNVADYGYVLKPAEVCFVPLEVLRRLAQQPDVSAAIIVQLTDRYKDALDRMRRANYESAESRVRWLVEYLEIKGIPLVSVTHDEMALILGMNRVTVTRMLSRL